MMKATRGALHVLSLVALMLLVTVGGVMAGALFVSPAATGTPWIRPAVSAVVVLVAVVALVFWLKPSKPSALVTTKPVARPASPAPAKSGFSLPTLSMPALSLGGKADRSPRAVQQMAAAGTAPTEISWRTGLPVDAVALLLAMSAASRQLQPPTA